MDIFTTIQGLKGENLTSEVLRYLVFNSSEVRSAFIKLLSDKSSVYGEFVVQAGMGS